MTQDQATQAVALLGGYTATAKQIKNLQGEPIHIANLRKAINAPRGVPDWLGEQIRVLVWEHMNKCENWLAEL
jgi:hypothetical protein